ncbi:MAG: hypothetical protein ACM3TT_13220 [Syntrophothermus sp.]
MTYEQLTYDKNGADQRPRQCKIWAPAPVLFGLLLFGFLAGMAGLAFAQALTGPANSKAPPNRKVQGVDPSLARRLTEIEEKLPGLEKRLLEIKEKQSPIRASGQVVFTAEGWQGFYPGAATPRDSYAEISQLLDLSLSGKITDRLGVVLSFRNRRLWGQEVSSVPGARNVNSNLLLTDEVYGRWIFDQGEGMAALGRQRFRLGPLGLLAATPTEALEGITVVKQAPNRLVITGLFYRLDAYYPLVTSSNVVFTNDNYAAARLAYPAASGTYGLNLLFSGMAGEQGGSLDYRGALWGKTTVAELALYSANPGDYDYRPGLVAAGVMSMDLYRDDKNLLNINLGAANRRFRPPYSNLRSAGGEIPFASGDAGVELNYSRAVAKTLVWDVEASRIVHGLGWTTPSELRPANSQQTSAQTSNQADTQASNQADTQTTEQADAGIVGPQFTTELRTRLTLTMTQDSDLTLEIKKAWVDQSSYGNATLNWAYRF